MSNPPGNCSSTRLLDATRSLGSGGVSVPLVSRRNVFGRARGSLAEEKLLHLLYDDFLVLLARRVQAIFVQQHLAVFHPLAPCLLRHIFVNLFSQFAVEWRLGKAG